MLLQLGLYAYGKETYTYCTCVCFKNSAHVHFQFQTFSHQMEFVVTCLWQFTGKTPHACCCCCCCCESVAGIHLCVMRVYTLQDEAFNRSFLWTKPNFAVGITHLGRLKFFIGWILSPDASWWYVLITMTAVVFFQFYCTLPVCSVRSVHWHCWLHICL